MPAKYNLCLGTHVPTISGCLKGIYWYVLKRAATGPPSGSREPQLQLLEGEPAKSVQSLKENSNLLQTLQCALLNGEKEEENKRKHEQL